MTGSAAQMVMDPARATHRAAGLPKAAVLGCAGPVLTDEERSFFASENPLGFILFQRNCEKPDQVATLISDLRASIDDPTAPVLIDQEGGRVQRLKPPHWRDAPPQGVFARSKRGSLDSHIEAAYSNARLIANELNELGITVDCLPCVDLPQPGSDGIIGDRASGPTLESASLVGAAVMEGLLEGGVLPVVKHLPGHGRAKVDSHEALPVVTAKFELLSRTDFAPFRALNWAPWGMTAHIIYTAIDRDRPATQSPIVIRDIIRGEIGFDGLLVSDDLSMKALQGTYADRANAALDAGCDLVLHCNGRMDEMVQVMQGVTVMGDEALRRHKLAQARLKAPEPFDYDQAQRALDQFLARDPGVMDS